MKEIVFVTSNDNKAREVATTLGIKIRRVSLELDEIQEMDLTKIVEAKAKAAYRKLKLPVIVEDVGFYVEEWNGFPGPFIKWMQETVGYDMLAKMVSKKNRNVEWVVAYGFYDGKEFHSSLGKLKGKIALSQRGGKAWGFDTIFIPKGYTKTTAELGVAIKLKISARRKALDKLAKFMKKSGRKYF